MAKKRNPDKQMEAVKASVSHEVLVAALSAVVVVAVLCVFFCFV